MPFSTDRRRTTWAFAIIIAFATVMLIIQGWNASARRHIAAQAHADICSLKAAFEALSHDRAISPRTRATLSSLDTIRCR